MSKLFGNGRASDSKAEEKLGGQAVNAQTAQLDANEVPSSGPRNNEGEFIERQVKTGAGQIRTALFPKGLWQDREEPAKGKLTSSADHAPKYRSRSR